MHEKQIWISFFRFKEEEFRRLRLIQCTKSRVGLAFLDLNVEGEGLKAWNLTEQ